MDIRSIDWSAGSVSSEYFRQPAHPNLPPSEQTIGRIAQELVGKAVIERAHGCSSNM